MTTARSGPTQGKACLILKRRPRVCDQALVRVPSMICRPNCSRKRAMAPTSTQVFGLMLCGDSGRCPPRGLRSRCGDSDDDEHRAPQARGPSLNHDTSPRNIHGKESRQSPAPLTTPGWVSVTHRTKKHLASVQKMWRDNTPSSPSNNAPCFLSRGFSQLCKPAARFWLLKLLRVHRLLEPPGSA